MENQLELHSRHCGVCSTEIKIRLFSSFTEINFLQWLCFFKNTWLIRSKSKKCFVATPTVRGPCCASALIQLHPSRGFYVIRTFYSWCKQTPPTAIPSFDTGWRVSAESDLELSMKLWETVFFNEWYLYWEAAFSCASTYSPQNYWEKWPNVFISESCSEMTISHLNIISFFCCIIFNPLGEVSPLISQHRLQHLGWVL